MSRKSIIVSLLVCVLVVVLAAIFASSHPDGLEWIAGKMGFENSATTTIKSPLPDYTTPTMGEGVRSTAVAGLLGVAAVFLGTVIVGRIFSGRKGRGKSVE